MLTLRSQAGCRPSRCFAGGRHVRAAPVGLERLIILGQRTAANGVRIRHSVTACGVVMGNSAGCHSQKACCRNLPTNIFMNANSAVRWMGNAAA
jgi:hypothetical protein